jgi:hypothetical protein
MSDASKPVMTAEQALHRAATTLPLAAVKDGMKACAMLKDLARVSAKAKADGQSLDAAGVLSWLASNGFEVSV